MKIEIERNESFFSFVFPTNTYQYSSSGTLLTHSFNHLHIYFGSKRYGQSKLIVTLYHLKNHLNTIDLLSVIRREHLNKRARTNKPNQNGKIYCLIHYAFHRNKLQAYIAWATFAIYRDRERGERSTLSWIGGKHQDRHISQHRLLLEQSQRRKASRHYSTLATLLSSVVPSTFPYNWVCWIVYHRLANFSSHKLDTANGNRDIPFLCSVSAKKRLITDRKLFFEWKVHFSHSKPVGRSLIRTQSL